MGYSKWNDCPVPGNIQDEVGLGSEEPEEIFLGKNVPTHCRGLY